MFDAAEKIEALEITPFDGTRLGAPVERADAGREIVQTGELFEITAVATEQDFTQVGTITGFVLSGLGAIGGAAVIGEALLYSPPEGWASLMAAVLLLSGVQLIILGIVGEVFGTPLSNGERQAPICSKGGPP